MSSKEKLSSLNNYLLPRGTVYILNATKILNCLLLLPGFKRTILFPSILHKGTMYFVCLFVCFCIWYHYEICGCKHIPVVIFIDAQVIECLTSRTCSGWLFGPFEEILTVYQSFHAFWNDIFQAHFDVFCPVVELPISSRRPDSF